MTRRGAVSLLIGALKANGSARGLGAFLDPAVGSALLLDARTGQVLASNRSAFTDRGAFPPGSTIKPFVLASLLATGKLRSDESFVCPGRLSINGRRMDCSHPQIGTAIRVDTALAYSCNCFVAHLAERFAPGELVTILRAWGFASLAVRPDQRLQALGEEAVLATPAEMAAAWKRLASPATPRPVIAGLEDAVEFGTGQLASVSWAKLAGKTGSARMNNEFIAWFAGFLPSRAPDVVVTVMLSGKHGSSDAAPIARRVLEAWKAGLA